MSKDVLSQEEIDALLQSVEAEDTGGADETAAAGEPAQAVETDVDRLPPLEPMEEEVLKALAEVFAGVADQLGAKGVRPGTVCAEPGFAGESMGGLRLRFEGIVTGQLHLYLPADLQADGEAWAEAMEVGVGSLVDGEVKAELVEGVPPVPVPLAVGQGVWIPYEGDERGVLWLGVPVELLENAVTALQSQMTRESPAAEAPVKATAEPAPRPTGQPASRHVGAPKPEDSRIPVQRAAFRPLSTSNGNGSSQNIDLLLDVPLDLRVELGRTKKSIRDVLALGPGSVIELDRLAGEAVDVMVNGKLIAKGEVVVIDESFGIRVTDVVSRVERINRLR